MKILQRAFMLLLITILMQACNNSLKTDSSTASFLDGKTLKFAGIDMKLKGDGSINFKSDYPDDPTQSYNGAWSTFGYEKSGYSGLETRNITITINQGGWVTDGIPNKGIEGIGSVLNGQIFQNHEFLRKPYIVFKVNSSEQGMQTYSNGSFKSAATEFNVDLE